MKRGTTKRLKATFETVFKTREFVTKKMEELRSEKIIGSSLEASVTLRVEKETYKALKKVEHQLEEIFIVSELSLQEGPFDIKVTKTQNKKCPRCWKFSKSLQKYLNFQEPICKSCKEAIGQEASL